MADDDPAASAAAAVNGDASFPSSSCRRIDDPTSTQPTLLSLPLSDLLLKPPPSSTAAAAAESGGGDDDDDDDDDDDNEEEEEEAGDLVLLQLPSAAAAAACGGGGGGGGGKGGLTLDDLLSNESYLVGPSSSSDDNPDGGGGVSGRAGGGNWKHKYNKSKQRVHLVTPRAGKTYGLTKIETSNAFVVVPPPPPPPSDADDDDDDGQTKPSPSKRPRLQLTSAEEEVTKKDGGGTSPHPSEQKEGESKQLPPAMKQRNARLLGTPGEPGATFLEPSKPLPLPLRSVRRLLRKFTYDPLNMDDDDEEEEGGEVEKRKTKKKKKMGWSIADLAQKLRRSAKEIETSLHALGAFVMPNKEEEEETETRYGTLSEETSASISNCLLATLTECYDDITIAAGNSDDSKGGVGVGVDWDKCVAEVKSRWDDEEAGSGVTLHRSVVEQCLRKVLLPPPSEEDKKAPTTTNGGEKTTKRAVTFDPKQISIVALHQVFLGSSPSQQQAPSSTSPFEQHKTWEQSALLDEYRLRMPDVGDLSMAAAAGATNWGNNEDSSSPSSLDLPSLLKGVAVRVDPPPNDDKQEEGKATTATSNAKTFYWRYLPSSSLPTDPKRRFRILFDVKDHWTESELEPYWVGMELLGGGGDDDEEEEGNAAGAVAVVGDATSTTLASLSLSSSQKAELLRRYAKRTAREQQEVRYEKPDDLENGD